MAGGGGGGGGGSDFFHKMGGVGKIDEGYLKEGGISLINVRTNPYQCFLSLSVWFVCAFCLFTPFVLVLFVFC